MRTPVMIAGLLLSLIAACGPAAKHASDAGADAGLDAGADAGPDAGSCAPDGNSCQSDGDCCNADCDQTQGLCSPIDCACACMTLLSAGGCANICNMNLNGTTTPNFCNGAPALTQCTNCLMTTCQFTAAQISETTACQ